MAAYGNPPCFDSTKLGRDSPSGYQPFFCDPNKPPESRLQKMNIEGGYGKLSMDPNFSDAYMMDGLGGSGYMPSGGLPQGPCSSSAPPMMGGPAVSHGYVGQNAGLHTNNYQSGPMSSSYLNPYMQFQGLGKVSHVVIHSLIQAMEAIFLGSPGGEHENAQAGMGLGFQPGFFDAGSVLRDGRPVQ